MDNKKIISILTEIESKFDVNSLTHNGLCVWPYIRIHIAYHLTHKDRKSYSHSLSASNIHPKRLIKQLLKFASLLKKLIKNKPLIQSDILFLCRTSERKNMVNGKWYNQHCDSFCDLFEKEHSIQILEFSDDGSSPAPTYRLSYLLEFQILINRLKYELARPFKQNRINNYKDLENCLYKLKIVLPFSEKAIRYRISLLVSQKKIFEKILKRCKPKLFFLVCYYYDIAMAAILACREQGIPAVEFQHGAQNDNNLYLTHWTEIPKQGYGMLPGFFWSWGESSALRINKWGQNTVRHKAFTGGNLWVSKWVNEKFETDDCSKYDAHDIFSKGFKHILITLQLWPEDFPDYLFQIIRNSPKDWFWHIRQHPRKRIPNTDLKKQFLSLPNIHIEEHHSREMPLYLLLKYVDLHLTGYSTVAFESALFQVPTIFFHKNALDGFQGLFDNKLFFYAENYNAMLSSMDIIFKRDQETTYKSSYINTDPQTHISCLKEMLETSQLNRNKESDLDSSIY